MKRSLMNWLYPRKCVFCKKLMPKDQSGEVCFACMQELAFCLERPHCKRCNKPVEEGEELCAYCKGEKKRIYTKLMAVCLYRDLVKGSILRFKRERYCAYAPTYANWMASVVLYHCPNVHFDAVISVPPRKKRMQKSGYDQAACLARTLAKELSLPYRKDALCRIKEGERQSGLSRRERFCNMEGSMKATANLEGVYLLVDDVCTTRATLLECARALKAAGAKKVYGVTFATTE